MDSTDSRPSKPNVGGSKPSRRAAPFPPGVTDDPGKRSLPHRRFCGSPADRFWPKVDKSDGPLACWLWLAKLDKDGYGTLWVSRQKSNYRAARFAYELIHGQLPGDRVIRHDCDNRQCVNPAHLTPGTQLDNMLDAVERGHLHARSNLVLGHLSKGRADATHLATPEAVRP